MKYQRGNYKYQLSDDIVFDTGILPPTRIEHPLFTFSTSGSLFIKAGYAYDGPSGITIDTQNFVWASLPHDVGYQMIRLKYLPEEYKEPFDLYLRVCCLASGMFRMRAWWVYRAVHRFGKPSIQPKNRKKVITYEVPTPDDFAAAELRLQ